MTIKKMAIEFGMGTDLQGSDYTKAAIRALKDALWHNSLNLADAFGFPRDAMLVDVVIGVTKPGAVDKHEVANVLPYGTAKVRVQEGGLDIPKPDGNGETIVASAAAIVSFDMTGGDFA